MYSYVWEFQVHPEHKADFEACYGLRGEWVRLFRRHPAYIQTVLLRDQSDPLRFLTVDSWKSREHYLAFHEEFREEIEDLDARCAAFTKNEQSLGEFEILG